MRAQIVRSVQNSSESIMKSALIAFVLSGFGACAVAQSASDILIGVSLPLSGPGAAAGKEGQAVMQGYIDSVNKAGDRVAATTANWTRVLMLETTPAPAQAVAPSAS